MSKHAPETRPVMTMWGRVVHAGWVNYFGDHQPMCGRSGLYTPVGQSDAVTCRRCRKMAQEAMNDHR